MMPMVATVAAAGPLAQRGYGGIELKTNYQKYWIVGFAIAVAIHMGLVGSYYLFQILTQEDEPVRMVRMIKYSDLGPPPSITSASTPPPISVSAPTAKPTVGAPVPVPDAEVSPEQTIATQTEMSQQAAPVSDLGAGGGNVGVEQDIKIDEDAPPADFVPVEKEPVVIKKVEPKYPDLAMRAGLEGKVWVKIWVDKEGKPKQAVVLKSDAEIFNQPSVDAAMQFLFTPAYMNNGPVAVWVSVPFRFKLADRK
jgi:protein TonB